jgi:hypothetical protein
MNGRLGAVVTALALVAPAAAAQEGDHRWYAELGGGYATSTDASFDSPGGGPAVTGFVGYRVSSLVTLGASLGWHQFVNGTTSNPSSCLPPAEPATDCVTEYDQDESAFEFAAAVRVGDHEGTWRPFGQLAVGYYNSDRSLLINQYDPDGILVGSSGLIESSGNDGVGGSIGAGLGYAPGGGRWSVNASTRFHAVLANTSGDIVWNTWLGFGLGVGVLF